MSVGSCKSTATEGLGVVHLSQDEQISLPLVTYSWSRAQSLFKVGGAKSNLQYSDEQAVQKLREGFPGLRNSLPDNRPLRARPELPLLGKQAIQRFCDNVRGQTLHYMLRKWRTFLFYAQSMEPLLKNGMLLLELSCLCCWTTAENHGWRPTIVLSQSILYHCGPMNRSVILSCHPLMPATVGGQRK